MMLSAPPPRALLLPGLSLRAGDLLGGRFRLVSLVSADRALVHLAAEMVPKHTKVDLFVLVGDDINDAVRLEFLAEARKTAALTSEHAARVLHVGVTADGHPFVVQERLPARTLATLLENGHSLEADHAVDIALDVCDALLEAHALDVTHAEIGTHSVHLDWNDDRPASVKLVGLATARVLASLPLDASTIGPPVMRAPELLADRRARGTVAADVWGMGVLLYTMLAGAPPFMAETPSAVSVSVSSEEQASLAGVPDAVAELVDACLSKDPAKRPATIRDVADRLLPFATKPAESLARIVARVERPKAPARTSLAPSPDLLAVTAAVPAAIPPAALPTQRAIPAALEVKTPGVSFAVGGDPSDVGGETGRYHALELERLQREVAKPAESELSIDVEIGASTREVAAVVEAAPASHRDAPTAAAIKAAKPAAAGEPDDHDEPAPTASAPPVAVTIPPPPSERAALVARTSEPKLAIARKHDASSDAKIAQADAEAKAAAARADALEAAKAAAASSSMRPVANTLAPQAKRSLRTSGAMTAAACLAAGIVLGILVPRAQSKSAAAAHEAPPTVTETVTPTLQTATIVTTPAPAAEAPKTPEIATTSAATLPEAKPDTKPAKGPRPLAPAPASATKAKPGATLPATPAPVRTVDTAPAAPAKPETKAHDDDLRRFLDDRR